MITSRAVSGRPARPRLPEWTIVALATIGAAALAWIAVAQPMVALAVAAGVAGLPLLTSPTLRVLFVVLGVIVLFGTSDELTTGKVLYLLGVGVATFGALWRVYGLTATAPFAALRPLFAASAAFVVLAGASLAVARLHGTPETAWLRDVAPYALFALAPLFALDAQSGLPQVWLRRLLAVAGLAAALSFGFRWFANRGITEEALIPIGFPSPLLAASLISFGFAVFLNGGSRRFVWLALGSIAFALLIATGTRTALIMLAAPLAIVLGTREHLARRAVRLAAALPLAGILLWTSITAIIETTNADTDVLQARAEVLFQTGSTTDRSYLDRLSQTRASWDAFLDAPVLGQGPGAPIVWRDSFGTPISSPLVDSSVAFLAKFGLLGVVWLLGVAVALVSLLRTLRRATGMVTTIDLAILGYLAVVLAVSILHVPFEDKGAAAAFLLLIGLAAREIGDVERERTEAS